MNKVVKMRAHDKGMKPTQRAVLSLKENLALDRILREHYTESGMDNVAFAAEVNATPEQRALFRFDLNKSHIVSALQAADIPPNRARRKADPVGDALGLTARVQELEEQLAKLAAYVKSRLG